MYESKKSERNKTFRNVYADIKNRMFKGSLF